MTLESIDRNYFFPALLLQLNYQTPAGTRVYLGNLMDGMEPGIALGVAQTFKDKSILDVSVYSQFLGNVWKDPYITGVDREETSVMKYGARLKYNYILGTGIKVHYRYRREDVDQDLIGERLADLKRDGDIHQVDVGYEFRLGQGHALTPFLSYTRAEMQGEANSYDGYGGKLGYKKKWTNLALDLSVSGDKKDYRRSDPIFQKKREDRDFKTMAMVSFLNPLGYRQFFVNVGTGFAQQYSNIDFYDSRTTFCFTTFGYNF